jgi:hypothetical protein
MLSALRFVLKTLSAPTLFSRPVCLINCQAPQRLIKIREQVFGVFKPDREP